MRTKVQTLKELCPQVERCRPIVLVFHKETKLQNPNEITLQVSYVEMTDLEVFR